MFSTQDLGTAGRPAKKLRSACDMCHRGKMKCSGGSPCSGCHNFGYECVYSVSNRGGRPKGTKNKRTLERIRQNEIRRAMAAGSSGCIEAQSQAASPTTSASDEPKKQSPAIEDVSFDFMVTGGRDLFSPSLGIEDFQPFSDFLNTWGDCNAAPVFEPPSFSSKDVESLLSHNAFDTKPLAPQPSQNEMERSSRAETQDEGSKEKDSKETFAYPTPSPTSLSSLSPRVSSIPGSPTCSCLQNHAELLCRLKDLEQKHPAGRVDGVLASAQEAISVWKTMLSCRVCQFDGDQEVLFLLAMSIRTFLRNMECLSIGTDGRCSSISSASSPAVWPQGGAEDAEPVKLTVGLHEVVGDDKAPMIDFMLLRTLHKARDALRCFKDRLDAVKERRHALTTSRMSRPTDQSFKMVSGQAEHGSESGDVEHLLQIWRGLNATAQSIERKLETWSPLRV